MGPDTVSRRRILIGASAAPLALAGTTVGPLAHLLPTASAAENSDFLFAQFAASLEAAAYVLYLTAGQGGPNGQLFSDFGTHHVHHAADFETFVAVAQAGPGASSSSGSSGPDPTDPAYAKGLPQRANPTLVNQYRGQVAAGGNSTLTALASLEEALAATYQWSLGQFQNKAGAKTVGSVLAVSGKRATALNLLAGQQPTAVVPDQQTDSGHLTESAYPTPPAEQKNKAGSGSSSGGGSS